MLDTIQEWLIGFGLSSDHATAIIQISALIVLAVISYAANYIAKRIVLRVISKIVTKTKTQWDDALAERKVFVRLSHLVPALIIWFGVAIIFGDTASLTLLARRCAETYMIIVGLLVMDSLLTAVVDIYRTFAIAKRIPIKGYVQVGKILLTITGVILIISVLLGKSPFLLLGGLTALTAVLLIVFKDTILNLVAGIQIQAYDMVRVGDWIVMPKYGADGDVSEIALNTVTVQNFDKTISTIPTRAVIDEYLKNWRGMKDSGGRRIKRSIAIDVNSIKFCTPVMITRLSRIQLLQAYIERKQKELTEHNAANGIDDESLANGRRMTNVGTFRAYLTEYLRGHPSIDTNKTFLVRQLQPTEGGLPIQIYVFANDTVWANYEAIQADIFDHVLAVLPEFELRICQNLTGHDLNELAQTLVSKWKGALS